VELVWRTLGLIVGSSFVTGTRRRAQFSRRSEFRVWRRARVDTCDRGRAHRRSLNGGSGRFVAFPGAGVVALPNTLVPFGRECRLVSSSTFHEIASSVNSRKLSLVQTDEQRKAGPVYLFSVTSTLVQWSSARACSAATMT
jgi:hypothetical protein